MEAYYPLIAALGSWFIAQAVKPFVYYYRSGRFDIQYTIASGGFPSSHSSTVTALAISVGIKEGFESTYFAIAFILAVIVVYDAVNVRYYAGKNIQLTKQLISDLEDMISLKLDDPIYTEKMKDVLGHRYVEAAGGIVLGSVIALSLGSLFGLL